MNTVNVLEYGHEAVLQAIDNISEIDWERPGVADNWSIKNILAHLTAYEYVLSDALYQLRGGKTTPTLDRWLEDAEAFNRHEMELRREDSFNDMLDEYREAHAETISQIIRIPEENLRQGGILPWYGEAYDAEDFITYASYGHKREHAAQIIAYRAHLATESVWKMRQAS